MKYIILKISLIICVISIVAGILVVLICSQNWQEGKTPDDWVHSGLNECEIEYEDFRFIECKYDDTECITYTYEAYNYDDIDTDNIGDIDLWYSKETKYTIYISFELNKNFWNKFTRFAVTNKQLYKYTKCLDFDITIIK